MKPFFLIDFLRKWFGSGKSCPFFVCKGEFCSRNRIYSAKNSTKTGEKGAVLRPQTPFAGSLLIAFALFQLSSLKAQSGFNKIYQQYPGVDYFERLIIHQDTIYAIGVGYDTINLPSPLQVLMTKTDTFGNIIKTKLHRDSLDEFLTMSFLYGNIIHTTRDLFAFSVFVFGRNANQIIQINKDLEVQSIFEYPIGDNKNEFYEQLLEMPDGGFMIAGSAQRSNLKQDGFVRRVDEHGNLLWEKYYGEYTKDEEINGIVRVSDNKFVLSGALSPNFNIFNSFKAVIWVIDSNGVIQNTWTSAPGAQNISVLTRMLPAPDGGFIAHGRTYMGEGPWGSKVQVCLMKFNAAFQFEWFQYIGPNTTYFNGVFDMTATPDGHYLLAGQRTSYGDFSMPSDDWGGWLYKFSEQGDSLWSRADNAPPGMNATGEYAYGGVGLLSSGSVVAGGKGDIDDKFVGWIVKVSANGCMDSLDCLISAVESVEEVGGMEVFPNPASDWIEVRVADQATGMTTLQIFDLAGRLLLQHFPPAGTNRLTLDIAGLPAGVYWIAIQQEANWMKQKMLVVHK
ncbi:MAG TPA: T9SS type A sorting domain-containing protein [Saprospiraceae bacterium]|nr:T9SS type A sorting domain-containing protein [Saprospiraceae bacterium]